MRYNKGDGRVPPKASGGPRDQQRRQAVGENQGAVIRALKEQLKEATMLLRDKPVEAQDGFTQEELEEEVRKSIEAVKKDTEDKYKDQLKELKKEVKGSVSLSDGNFFTQEEVEREAKAYGKALLKGALEKQTAFYEDKLIKLKEEKTKLEIDNKGYKEVLKVKDEMIEVLKQKQQVVHVSEDGFIETDPNRPKIEDVYIDPLEKTSGDGFEKHITVDDVPTEEKEKITDKVDKLKNLMGKLPKRK
jgi:hypothetical protein